VDLRAAPRFLTPVLGLACWVQLALVPLLGRRAAAAPWLLAALPLAALGLGARESAARPGRALALYALAFPVCLAAAAAAGGTAARYDAPGQVVVTGTVAAFFGATAWAWSAARERVPAVVVASAVSESGAAPGPPMRAVGLVALVAVALTLSVVAPLGVSRAASLHPGLGGAALLRGRLALVTAGGLSLAVLWTFVVGGGLLRRAPAPPRSGARAWFYLCAATVAFAMRYWLDHAR
jgi:hypothetical protein